MLDVFVQVACFISRGGNLTVIGKETSNLQGNDRNSTKSKPRLKKQLQEVSSTLIIMVISLVILIRNFLLMLEKEEILKSLQLDILLQK